MDSKIVIRRGTEVDIESIVEFNQMMAMETENKTLDTSVLQQGVASLLHNSERGFYLMACIDRKVVGQLLITYEWSDWRNGTFWWVQSVYVHPEYRRQGVYRKLYAQARKEALAAEGVCGLRLYVMESNDAAQRTYTSMGMERTEYRLFEEEFPSEG